MGASASNAMSVYRRRRLHQHAERFSTRPSLGSKRQELEGTKLLLVPNASTPGMTQILAQQPWPLAMLPAAPASEASFARALVLVKTGRIEIAVQVRLYLW